jgi:hypothetical protein
MTAKPILIVRLPKQVINEITIIAEGFTEKFNDYHVLCLLSDVCQAEFECYYEKDFNEVNFEELKQIVESRLRSIE